MRNNFYLPGQWNVTCDVCSKKIKIGEARKRWDGFLVCADDYEMRHPQDFIRARQDKISVPITRPIPNLVFTGVPTNQYWDPMYTLDGYIDGDLT